jgi:methylase of polypeptide subunit release factors
VTIDLSGESSSSNEQDLAEDSMKSLEILEIIYRAPSKFMKYIKREELAYGRLASTTNEKLTDTTTYRDLQLTYPTTSLRPRESSGVIVEACNKYLANAPSKPAILELGCASGALILAVLNENKGRNITGFGLDIDKNSLLYAENNAKNNKIDGKITFLDGDFTKLHLIQTLSPPGDGNERGYDVIFSNPPYFAQQKIVNRVTSEGKHVLSANGDGLEYYELILQSINLFYSYNKRHLISPQGVVVLQIPGNKLSFSKVKEIVERNSFKMVEVIYDKRPRDGDATDMLIRGIVCQSASPAK